METPVGTRTALLLALRDGPGYGLDLIRRVAGRTGGHVRLTAARVYPALQALERERLVRSSVVAPGGRRGARARTYYDLTIAGVNESTRLRDALSALAAGRPRPEPSAAERKKMAQRVLLGGALS